jgi:hypothetical protein
MELEKRLKKCCCKVLKYSYKSNEWYLIELLYNKSYFRFFALSYDQLERESLSIMREKNRKLEVKKMTRGEVRCLNQ